MRTVGFITFLPSLLGVPGIRAILRLILMESVILAPLKVRMQVRHDGQLQQEHTGLLFCKLWQAIRQAILLEGMEQANLCSCDESIGPHSE